MRDPRPRFEVVGYNGGHRVYDHVLGEYVGKVFDRPEKAQRAANRRQARAT